MIEAVSYALFCGFALSALLVPLTALAMRRADELGGATRHTIWFMVLVATVAATCVAFAVSVVRPAQQFSVTMISAAMPAPGAVHAAGVPPALCVLFLACWLIVSIVRMFLIARRIGALRAMKHRATPIEFDCDLPRGARALASEANAPSAVGFLHPAILLPSAGLDALDPKDARLIVLHEAAHLRRRDDLTGLVFLTCAAMFWFNPFVHHIGKKLSLECEIACDECVVEQTGDAARYATLLFEMAQSIAGGGPQLAWTGFVHPSGLVVRIRNLVLDRDARHRAPPWPALAVVVGVLVSSVGLAAFNAPALGRAENHAPPYENWVTSGDSAMPAHRAIDEQVWVRDYPVCETHPDPATRNDTNRCEDPAMQHTPSTTRIKKGTSTP